MDPTWEDVDTSGWEDCNDPFDKLCIKHGDVLVVQEHPDRLPCGLPTAKEWIPELASIVGASGRRT